MKSMFNSAPAILRNLIIILFAGSVVFVYSRMDGIVGRTELNGSGCTCHGPASANVSLEIIGPDEVETGASAEYIARLSGGPASKAGINIAGENATLSPVSSFLKSLNSELTHSSPVTMSADSIDFVFSVTAPESEGTFTLYAAGNSTNGNSSTSGDAWNNAPSKTITITPGASAISTSDLLLPVEFTLGQNYPNPFNPQTRIPFSLNKQSYVKLTIYDVSGRKIATLVDGEKDAGNHNVTFDASQLNSGAYIYQIRNSDQVLTKKMLVVK